MNGEFIYLFKLNLGEYKITADETRTKLPMKIGSPVLTTNN